MNYIRKILELAEKCLTESDFTLLQQKLDKRNLQDVYDIVTSAEQLIIKKEQELSKILADLRSERKKVGELEFIVNEYYNFNTRDDTDSI